jgi:two-component system chemotaxis sensor kinase CheA
LFEADDTPDPSNDNWHLSIRFGAQMLKRGADPMSFLRTLRALGTVTGIATLVDNTPPLGLLDPECCYMGFEIGLRSNADKAALESVFDAVREDCAIRILPPASRVEEYIKLIEELPEETLRLGEMLVHCGTLTAYELETALAEQSRTEPPTLPIGELLIQRGSVNPPVVEAALARQSQIREARAENRSIRVDADKLDRLINLVGELIISAAGANLIANGARIPELEEATSTLSSLVEEVRDSALQLRMVKIGATFSRFQRVVHDVSRELGKDITLVVSGEDAELDKTVVEKLADPLTHLVRNAMDHGIDAAATRVARGKAAQGTVRLNAYHDSGSIVIEVSDDGGGLDRDRIFAKAVERGLVEAGRNMSDGEVYALIFEPGFSTAEQITNLSGRGVGMDVVKRNIEALRGTVDIQSSKGAGTTVSVRLPLTLAIIDGFMVGIDETVFVVPLDMIEECVEFSAEAGHDYTNLRGEVLPFIRLREIFGIGGEPARRQSIVVIRHAGQKAGLVVDTLLGEFQTVIKPLGRMFSHVKCISGSTIRGNGEVALILDVPALMERAGSAAVNMSRADEKPILAN